MPRAVTGMAAAAGVDTDPVADVRQDNAFTVDNSKVAFKPMMIPDLSQKICPMEEHKVTGQCAGHCAPTFR